MWVAVSMVDLVTHICAESETAKNRRITEKALISRLRQRFQNQQRLEANVVRASKCKVSSSEKKEKRKTLVWPPERARRSARVEAAK
jgi:hypothetical protein